MVVSSIFGPKNNEPVNQLVIPPSICTLKFSLVCLNQPSINLNLLQHSNCSLGESNAKEVNFKTQ